MHKMESQNLDICSQPKEKRDQVRQKNELKKEFSRNKQSMYDIKKRIRSVKSGWRNGVVGVE